MALKLDSSISGVFTSLSSTLQPKTSSKVISRAGPIYFQQFDAENLRNHKGIRKLTTSKGFPRRPCIFFATAEDQEVLSEFKPAALEQESHPPPAEEVSSSNFSFAHDGAGGRPGFVSFYGQPHTVKEEVLVPVPVKNENAVLWFVGPAILVASFIFPSLYLRRILSTIFEDSLLTDFLILFFTEALFYCGVAIFLLLIDRLRRPIEPVSSEFVRNDISLLAQRISSVAILLLSLIIPMVTMGFVWPWTGPAASATLAPYLVGIVVQFAFEQYAKYCKSPSRPAIPVIFQVYRLHQLNRAAQLVTALSFTVRGAEMTPQNLAINGSLSTLLNVLQVLGVICIWSLSSFIMRLLPSATMLE